jgi:hypothetical protein
MNQNLWAALKMGASNGMLAGGYGFAGNMYYVGRKAPVFGQRVDTISDALARMDSNDILYLGPQEHAEGNLVIPEGLDNITIIGMGNRGSCFIEAPVTTDEGLTVLGDDVTLINVGVAGGDTGDYSLQVGSADVSPARFRAYGCKFENSPIAVRLYGCGDTILDDCEICWAASGMVLRSNLSGFVTQARIKNCLFHNYDNFGVGHHAAAQQVNDLWLVDNVFGRQEDGVAGTNDILLSDNANTGFITGNRFPRATNGTGFITIGTGLIYNPNGTEAGWSTARPA